MKKQPVTKLERAQKKVANIKGFYNHLTVYIIINCIVLFTSGKFIFILFSEEALGNPKFLDWINWNVYGTPIIWGIVLLIHGLVVFGIKPSFLKNWEQKQLEKYMRE
ncbi:MAG: 2TM domain-containing protein [Cellulophaga sp.]|nr:2TM domain-containing protein [Cellulophaga sp.]